MTEIEFDIDLYQPLTLATSGNTGLCSTRIRNAK